MFNFVVGPPIDVKLGNCKKYLYPFIYAPNNEVYLLNQFHLKGLSFQLKTRNRTNNLK